MLVLRLTNDNIL